MLKGVDRQDVSQQTDYGKCKEEKKQGAVIGACACVRACRERRHNHSTMITQPDTMASSPGSTTSYLYGLDT